MSANAFVKEDKITPSYFPQNPGALNVLFPCQSCAAGRSSWKTCMAQPRPHAVPIVRKVPLDQLEKSHTGCVVQADGGVEISWDSNTKCLVPCDQCWTLGQCLQHGHVLDLYPIAFIDLRANLGVTPAKRRCKAVNGGVLPRKKGRLVSPDSATKARRRRCGEGEVSGSPASSRYTSLRQSTASPEKRCEEARSPRAPGRPAGLSPSPPAKESGAAGETPVRRRRGRPKKVASKAEQEPPELVLEPPTAPAAPEAPAAPAAPAAPEAPEGRTAREVDDGLPGTGDTGGGADGSPGSDDLDHGRGGEPEGAGEIVRLREKLEMTEKKMRDVRTNVTDLERVKVEALDRIASSQRTLDAAEAKLVVERQHLKDLCEKFTAAKSELMMKLQRTAAKLTEEVERLRNDGVERDRGVE